MRYLFVLCCGAGLLAGCGGTSSGVATTTAAPVEQTIATTPVQQIDVTPDATDVVLLPDITTPSDVTLTSDFGALINGVRGANGVGDLVFDARLGVTAQNYAETMLSEGRFDHVGSDGSTAGDRAIAEGYNFSVLRENIAASQTNVDDVFAAWQNSSGHRANNLAGDVEDFGLGYAGSGSDTRWVLVLGAEQ